MGSYTRYLYDTYRSIGNIKTPKISRGMNLEDLFNLEKEHLVKVAALLTHPPVDRERESHHDSQYPLLAPVHAICILFKHPIREERILGAACAFAFGPRYLFTAGHVLEYCDKEERDESGKPLKWILEKVTLSDPLKFGESLPRPVGQDSVIVGRNWAKVNVLYKDGFVDAAILEAPFCRFRRIEFEDSASFCEKVFLPELLTAQPGQPILRDGRVVEIYTKLHAGTTCGNVSGMSGAPVINIRGRCLGMHLNGTGDLSAGPRTRFLTLEGLLHVLVCAQSSQSFIVDRYSWGLKMIKFTQEALRKRVQGRRRAENLRRGHPAKRRRRDIELDLESDAKLAHLENLRALQALKEEEEETQRELYQDQLYQNKMVYTRVKSPVPRILG
ncbi:hypothetical protein TWF506_009986 [Arthrobotrys conoides]|uniref:Serine protease n=1 Tax=Arthrobotrys conoides TaxID=74498 RepID=A0AAN8RWR5_9PEZI